MGKLPMQRQSLIWLKRVHVCAAEHGMAMVFRSLSNRPSLEIREGDILTEEGVGERGKSWASYERSTFCGIQVFSPKF